MMDPRNLVFYFSFILLLKAHWANGGKRKKLKRYRPTGSWKDMHCKIYEEGEFEETGRQTCQVEGVTALDNRGKSFRHCWKDDNGKMDMSIIKVENDEHDVYIGKKCERQEMFCLDCDRTALCWKNGNDFQIVHTEGCRFNHTCSSQTHNCIKQENPSCKDKKYTCFDRGYFPDPLWCERYYYCSEVGALAQWRKCGVNSYFDIARSSCVGCQSDLLPCPPKLPCTKTNKALEVKENPNMYYKCSGSFPGYDFQFYRCPKNQIFVEGECTPPENVEWSDYRFNIMDYYDMVSNNGVYTLIRKNQLPDDFVTEALFVR